MSTSKSGNLNLKSPPPALPTSVAGKAALKSLRSLLGSTLRVTISDPSGRIFIGTFVCIDKPKNIILANTEEYRVEKIADYKVELERRRKMRKVADADVMADAAEVGEADIEGTQREVADEDMAKFERKGRYVGMVMIPWRHIIDVEEEDPGSSLVSALSNWII